MLTDCGDGLVAAFGEHDDVVARLDGRLNPGQESLRTCRHPFRISGCAVGRNGGEIVCAQRLEGNEVFALHGIGERLVGSEDLAANGCCGRTLDGLASERSLADANGSMAHYAAQLRPRIVLMPGRSDPLCAIDANRIEGSNSLGIDQMTAKLAVVTDVELEGRVRRFIASDDS